MFDVHRAASWHSICGLSAVQFCGGRAIHPGTAIKLVLHVKRLVATARRLEVQVDLRLASHVLQRLHAQAVPAVVPAHARRLGFSRRAINPRTGAKASATCAFSSSASGFKLSVDYANQRRTIDATCCR